ncbi:MAG: TerC family protein [Pseudolabrys sp.]
MIDILSGLGVNLGANMQPQFWVSVVEIIWINVLLSGDNAIVIALACRGLVPKQRLAGVVLGTGIALLLRVAFTSVVVTLMFVPYLKIAGGAALFWISLKLLAPGEPKSLAPDKGSGKTPAESVFRAVTVIAIADIVMSLDNVIAVAAAAKGNFALLIFGLGFSIPIIIAGATVFMAIVSYFPLIIWAGAAVLGWLAGDLIATDPVVIDGARAFGPTAHEKIALTCSIVATAGTLLGGFLVRARHPLPA